MPLFVDILTPHQRVVKDAEVDALSVPTHRGQIHILPGHTHLLTELSPGPVSLFGGRDDPDRFFSVTRGLCKILDQKVSIFSETAEESHTIDRERAQAALQHALELLKSGDLSTDEEIEKFQRKVERAQIRLQLAESSPHSK